MKKLYIVTVLVLIVSSGCRIYLEDLGLMDMYNKLVFLMPLETMFPDESVRALAKAAGQGRVKTVEALVNLGVDINSSGTQRATPLFWAAMRKRNYKGFKKLLELGADPNAYFIIDSDLPNIAYGNIETIMHGVTNLKDSRFLEAALQHGGNPNIIDNNREKKTPIFRLITSKITVGKRQYYRDTEKIGMLLDAGANIDAQDYVGMTPVMRAFRPNLDVDFTLYLLERGADYNTIEEYRAGLTLVNMVANRAGKLTPEGELKRLKVVEWLESRGVVMDKKELLPSSPIEQP